MMKHLAAFLFSLALPIAAYADVIKFHESGVWVRPAGVVAITVEMVGGGGPGGPAQSVSPGQCSAGAGGSAAAYARKTIDVSEISSALITVGQGGSGCNGCNGTHGSASKWDDGVNEVVAGGGHRAGHLGAGGENNFVNSGFGGSATGGDINVSGEPGGYGMRLGGEVCVAGAGANTVFGTGGKARVNQPGNNLNSRGRDGGHGAGGAGAISASHNAPRGTNAGGDGGDGIVIIKHHYQ